METTAPSFGAAARVWAQIGLLSFGGPAGQIALMHKMLVEERRWISDTRFLHALNYCMLLPGPEAQQLATYIGWLLHGTRGGIVAGALFVLPGFCLIVALSVAYVLLADADWIAGIFFGLKAAVLAIVLNALWRLSRKALKTPAMLAVAAVAFVALFFFGVPFPVVVIGAGLLGFATPGSFAPVGHGAEIAEAGETPAERERAARQAGWRRALAVLAIGGVLWAAPVVMAGVIWGWPNTFTAIGLFFSQMAVVTFGGAYAVLAYVAQQAVEAYGWLAPGEMLDGLALAETTPGPLVLVLTFVGFLAGARSQLPLDPVWGGVLGATLATWVTFVPCFIWIFLGAPHIERLRANRALSGALSAITAAVVGVILNLALWFGLNVLFRRDGDWTSLDPMALLLAVAAALALIVFKIGIVPVLGAAALAGWVLSLLA